MWRIHLDWIPCGEVSGAGNYHEHYAVSGEDKSSTIFALRREISEVFGWVCR
jgi:hypothetical protein